MDKCIFDFSAHFEMIYLTAAWRRKTTLSRERESGCGHPNTEDVCTVNTGITMSYLITVWMSGKRQ